nr:GH92 family glycosyl hydrolase [Flavobacteriaceae bacterium]
MKKLSIILLLFLTISCQKKSILPKEQNLTQYVNPFIGTDGVGNTYPGTTVPFGMVQLSPDIGIGGWDRIAGYFYKDSIITGFSHTHLTGTGAGDLYDILTMPTNSRFNKRIKENNGKPFSHFNHQNERATAGYYQVKLLDYGINAELTATPRVGIHRYTFPKDEQSKITVDLGFAMNWDSPTDTYIKVVDNKTIEGYRKSNGWARKQQVYFTMSFSRPFDASQLYKNGSKITEQEITAKDTKIELSFKTSENEQIIVKTGLSSANCEGAKKAILTEAPHFEFDKYKEQAKQLWEKELSKITIQTEDKDTKTIFYTMLYQSMLAPTLYSDANGNYKGANHQITKAKGFHRYDTFSLWDTFRAAHPLYTILHPQKSSDFIKS